MFDSITAASCALLPPRRRHPEWFAIQSHSPFLSSLLLTMACFPSSSSPLSPYLSLPIQSHYCPRPVQKFAMYDFNLLSQYSKITSLFIICLQHGDHGIENIHYKSGQMTLKCPNIHFLILSVLLLSVCWLPAGSLICYHSRTMFWPCTLYTRRRFAQLIRT